VVRDVEGTVIHLTRWRETTVYPATPAPVDPDTDERVVTGWAFVITLLVLLPPLGWLQLSHRRDVAVAGRLLIAAVTMLTVAAAWQTAFNVLYP
jgi:hypothetical protein